MNTPDLIKASVSSQRTAHQKGYACATTGHHRQARELKQASTLTHALYGCLFAFLVIAIMLSFTLGGK